MKRILALLSIAVFISASASAQDIMHGITNQVSIIAKSSKLPQIKMKDGMSVSLRYVADEGIHVEMHRNGKNDDFVDPIADATYVQIGEYDVDGDGKMELLVASRSERNSFTIEIYTHPQFEYDFQLWTTIAGTNYVEFAGNSALKLYDVDEHATSCKLTSEGKLKVIE